MVTPELITYIRQQLAAGIPKEKIAKTLAPNGWSSQEISQAFLSISSPDLISSIGQKSVSPSFVGRKILLSSGLIITSGLYVFFQYAASSPKTSAIMLNELLPKQNTPVSSPVVDIVSSPNTPTVVEQTPLQSARQLQPDLTPDPSTTRTPVPATPTRATVHKPVTISKTVPIPAPVSTPAPIPGPKPKGQYADGTYTGNPADAYYGMVQVRAVIQNGALSDLRILQYPNDRNTSIRINSQALPILRQEAIASQSANIDAVSGASDTSPAFIESLSSALAQAKN